MLSRAYIDKWKSLGLADPIGTLDEGQRPSAIERGLSAGHIAKDLVAPRRWMPAQTSEGLTPTNIEPTWAP
jgi:hypothetical protein